MTTARKAWTAVILAMFILLGGIGIAAEVSAEGTAEEGEFPELVVTEERITGVLGGGDFIGIHNKDNDAMIGVLYGTNENPNHVYVVSIFTRYLGVADIYNENGEELASGRPIPVRTLYAQRFDTIYEFEDGDGDGIWDSRRMSQQQDPGQGNDSDVLTRDPVYKRVSLNTAWSSSGVTRTDNGNGSVEWEITLTATDLGYKGPLLGLPVDRQNSLEKVELTFHLYAQKRNVTKDDFPVYRVEVGRNGPGWRIEDVDPEGNRSYSGVAVSADVKYDHYIEGWDFHPRNDNPSLMLSTEVLFLTAVSPRASEWIRSEYREKLGANGTASFESGEGMESIGSGTIKQVPGDPVLAQNVDRPRIVRKNSLGFTDDWDRIGRLTWVSDVTVDGNDTEMYFQVYMGRAFAGINANGAIYAGFGLVAGFSYPGGSSIYHDPGYQVEAFSISEDDEARPLLRLIVAGLVLSIGVALVIVVGVVVVGGLMAMRRKESMTDSRRDEDYYETYYTDDNDK